MIRAFALTMCLGLVSCSQEAATPAPLTPVAMQEADLVTAFPTGTLIIPMDTTSQNNGTLRAFGLVDRLLRANVPVQRVSLTGKAAGATDFSATVTQQEGGAALGTVAYRAGPFLVSGADVTPAVLTLVNTYLAGDAVTNVHVATAPFSADVRRTLVAAPRIAVLRDGNEAIAYGYLNAANILDSAGNAWSNTSPGALTLASVQGAAIGTNDGALFTGAVPAFDQLTSMHYTPPANNELVREVRAWLSLGPTTHAYMQCDAINAFENNVNGHFLSDAGIVDDGATANPDRLLAADNLFAQFDGTFTVDTGSVDSMGLNPTSGLYANSSLLIDLNGATTGTRMVWLTGFIDGDPAKGKISYLAGHNYSVTLPISTNPGTNGVRLFLNGLYETPGLFSADQPVVSVVKSAPITTSAANFTFTISYSNAGPGAIFAATLTDVLPPGTTFVSATGGGVNAAGTVTWTLGNLAKGAAGSVTVTVSAPEGTYANRATLAYTLGATPKSMLSNTTSTIVDRTAPNTTLTSTPAALSASSSAAFTFTGTEPGSFECSLDAAAFAACTTPRNLVGLADGSHTFQVRALDAAGNADPTPASFTWTVDTTPPNTTLTSTPAAVSNSASAAFSFTATEAGTFECSLDGAAFAVCTTPSALAGLADGSHTFLVRARDTAGNVDATPASFTWTVDTQAPDTSLTSTPPALSNSASATFAFTGTEPGTFECSLDGAAFAACTSPSSLSGLADGSHTFLVRALDTAGNADATPASFTWTVDTTPPNTTLTSTPPALSNSASTAFSFNGTEPGTFECSLDGAAFSACTSPISLNGLADGSHTFLVRARDAAGNVDPTPASFTWTVDTTVPDTTLTTTPPAASSSASANFAFTSTEPGSFECSLDGAAFSACPSPQALSGLAEGSHTFQVRALDAAGNVDPTPASFTWTVDLTPSDTSITSGPAALTNTTSATLAFTATEAGSTFECAVDGASFAACTSPLALTGLTAGSHTVLVRAVDAAGNVDPTPASRTWVIDLTEPDTTITSGPPALSTSNAATIAFDSSEFGSTFECALDGAAFTTCAAPLGLTSLSDGSHTLLVRAIDGAGNVDATPASRTWTVDTVAPDTTLVSGPSGSVSTTTATFVATSEASATFECSLDGAAFAACSASSTWPGLADGSHTLLIRAVDAAGNADPTPASRTWTVDTVLPDTTIASGPSGTVGVSTANFTFTSGESPVTFECSLDAAAFAACPAATALTALADGNHTLAVRAIDDAGNIDSTPATRSWTVDTQPPDTTLTSAPTGTTNVSTATIAFTSTEVGATFQCSLDGAAFTTCTGPVSLTALADGAHTFAVRAVDAAGNVDPSPVAASWTVDALVPDTTITAGPTGTVNTASAAIAFTSTKVGSTFECSLDGASFSACTSTASLTALSDGSHTFQVRATDAVGNVDPTPASRTWTVDTQAPDTTITAQPPAFTNATTGQFQFSSAEAGATFQCSLDGAAWATCSAPLTTTGTLADGVHVMLVRALDAAGNVDATPARATWEVDTLAPAAPLITEPVADATTGALPRFGGLAEPGTVVAVTVNGATVCSATAAADGHWTCTATTPLASGAQTATATATDAAGNTSQPSLPRAFNVDGTKPDTVILTGPAALTNVARADFTVASDASAATFECSLDGAVFTACTASPSFSSLADGPHHLAVRAVNAGAADPSPATRDWTLDTTAPGAPVITSPAASGTTSATPTFTGTAEPGSTVVVSVDGQPACSAVADATGAFSCAAPSALPPGAHTVTATATDPAGNASPPSTGVPFTIDGATLDTAIIAGPSGTVTATSATFAFTSTVVGATFECSLDGAAFVACLTPVTFSGLSEGSHTLAVRAVNGASVDTTPATRTWSIDSGSPTAPTVVAPADQATVRTRTPRYSGTAQPGTTVIVSVDDREACTAVADTTGAWSCTGTADLGDGPHRVAAVARDAAGNTSPPSMTNRFVIDIPSVTVAITAPATGALTNDSTPAISGTATAGSTVSVFSDGMLLGTALADANGRWTFTPTTPLADGAHALTASAALDGLLSPVSAAVTVRIDTQPPVVTLTLTQETADTTPVVTFTSDETPVTFTCSLDGAAFSPCASPLDVTATGEGNHSLVVRATDAAGNTGEATRTWVVTAKVAPTPALEIRGGGCGCGSTDGSSVLLAALAMLALVARRSRRGLRQLKAAPLLLGVVLLAPLASAQVSGFDIERLDLNPGATASLVTGTGDLMRKGAWRASLLVHYEHDPLVLYRLDTNERLGAVVGSRLTTHLMGAWAPLDWLEVGLQLPIVLWQGGDDLSGYNVNKPATTALGTTWLTGRFGILRERAGAPLDLSVQVGLGLPFGSAAAYSNATPVAFAPRVGAGKSILSWLRLGAEVGFMVHGAPTAGAVSQAGAASSFSGALSATTLGTGLRGELTLRTTVALDASLVGGELLLGARYPLGKWVEVYAIGGPGLGTLPGNPAFRILAGLSVQPPVAAAPEKKAQPAAPRCDDSVSIEVLRDACGALDADGDGIANAVDACPRVAGVAAAHGCPIGDTDDDGLTDDVDACPKEAGPRERKGCPIKDQDKDGVEDAVDACPAEAGPVERQGCPLKDQDGDTVEDAADACPAEAGPVERKGCPIKDQDGDTVEDAVDNCPTVKGTVENAGCPAKQRQLVIITADKLVIKEAVYFATGKAVVLARSNKLLDNVAEVLLAHPEVLMVRIEGHTDSVGVREKNIALSQARADAVKAQLVKRKVPAERLKAVGSGPDQPKDSNDTAAGREQNRRVEFNFETAASP